MSSCVAYYLAAFAIILTHNIIIPVKGQCTVHGCDNGDSSINIVAEIQQLFAEAIRQHQNEQVQSIYKLLNALFQHVKNLNASFQQIKNQQDTVMTSLQAADQRSQEQNICMKQVQSIHGLLNASNQQMKTEHDTVVRSLEAIDRRLSEHDISIKNQTQNSLKLAAGVPVQLEIGLDLGEGLVLLPTLNNWVIIMHRFDGSVNFNRNWTEYRNGFGEIGRGEFWLGNEKVHRLTNGRGLVYTLRIELCINGTWFYADYDTFSLGSENNKYALRLAGYRGNAGDSLTNTSMEPKFYHDGVGFSTKDSDNDLSSTFNCAQGLLTGWWFNRCGPPGFTCLTCKEYFGWLSLRHLSSDSRLQAARMMIKSI